MFTQVYELPPDADRWYAELAAIRDLRGAAPFGRLHFPQMDPGSPEGVALVLLPSGHYVEIVEHGTTDTEGLYLALRFGKDGQPEQILDELLEAAELTTEHLLWTELGVSDNPLEAS